MERKNTNQILGMEYEGVESSNLSGEEISFPKQPRKHDNGCALKSGVDNDCGFKAAFWTLENKSGNVQCNFEIEFNFRNDW